MANLGVLTTEFAASSLAETLDAVVGHDVHTVQLQLGSVFTDLALSDSLRYGLEVTGDRLSIEVAHQVAELMTEREVALCAVDGTYNMIHPDLERRSRNLQHLLRLIDLAGDLDTRIVTLCTGSRADVMWVRDPENASAEAWSDLVADVSTAADAAERAGVTLAFEPEINNVVNSITMARRLLDEVDSPALQVLLDPANVFHHGDLDRMAEHLQDAVDQVAGQIALAHAKDLDHEDDAGQLGAGRGLLDYTTFLAALQKSGYDGAVVLHQLHGLTPAQRTECFDHVRSHAPVGYLK